MFYLSLYIAHLTNLILRFFKLGAGMTLPGFYALKIYPQLLNNSKINFKNGVIVVSGTNGKTTTSKLITHILNKKGFKVLNNSSGANVLNGIASAILLNTSVTGKVKSDIAVLEVDEFFLPSVLKHLNPHTVVLLNLSRDQLDRYGEVDIVYEKWKAALSEINQTQTVVFTDSTQSVFKDIKDYFRGKVIEFGDSGELLKSTSLVGYYNAKNVNAAFAVCRQTGLEEDEIVRALHDFEPAYGRGEEVMLGEIKIKILLAKNPASFNTNLDVLISKEIDPDAVCILLNDNIPDGRDVSWIFDIDSEKFKIALEGREIFISGNRYRDMAVRLKYAEVLVEENNCSKNYQKILDRIKVSGYKNVLVLPNYSSMLEVRKILTGKKIL